MVSTIDRSRVSSSSPVASPSAPRPAAEPSSRADVAKPADTFTSEERPVVQLTPSARGGALPGSASPGALWGAQAATLDAATGAGREPVLKVPQEDLARGDEGEAVRRLQDCLITLGLVPRESVNPGYGTFGPLTQGAVQRFQQEHGLEATGVFDGTTRAAMEREIAFLNEPPPPGDAQKPPVTWVESPNQSSRNGARIDTIVLHHTASNSVESDLATLTSPEAQVSSHYLIGRDGTIYQLVDDEMTAWHAGVSDLFGETQPTVNERSIGIEITNAGDGTPFTEAQYQALERLVPYLAQKYGIPPANIVGHKDVAIPRERKSDPAANFDSMRIRQAVLALRDGGQEPGPTVDGA